MKQLLLIILTSLSFLSFAQNLVPYPGFEMLKTDSLDPVKRKGFWSSATTGGTPDFFPHIKYGMPPKNNIMPTIGNGYAGIYVYQDRDFREYLQIKLKEPLQQGKTYSIELNTSLSEFTTIALKTLGIYFSKVKILEGGEKPLYLQPILLSTANKDFIYDNWSWVCGTYTARGGEQYIVLGNFSNNNTTVKKAVPRDYKMGLKSYYYFDSIIVQEASQDFSCNPLKKLNEKKLNESPVANNKERIATTLPADVNPTSSATNTFPLIQSKTINLADSPHVYFETGSAVLNEDGKYKLERFATILRFSLNDIELKGFADNTGSMAGNKKFLTSVLKQRQITWFLLAWIVSAYR